jgi:hypothetical protein
MSVLVGSIVGAAGVFYVHVLVQLLRESGRQKRARLRSRDSARVGPRFVLLHR